MQRKHTAKAVSVAANAAETQGTPRSGNRLQLPIRMSCNTNAQIRFGAAPNWHCVWGFASLFVGVGVVSQIPRTRRRKAPRSTPTGQTSTSLPGNTTRRFQLTCRCGPCCVRCMSGGRCALGARCCCVRAVAGYGVRCTTHPELQHNEHTSSYNTPRLIC